MVMPATALRSLWLAPARTGRTTWSLGVSCIAGHSKSVSNSVGFVIVQLKSYSKYYCSETQALYLKNMRLLKAFSYLQV